MPQIRMLELIEEAEGKDSFDVEFIEEFVRRSDEIHNAVVKAGGIAPTSGQAAKALEQMKAEEGVPSVPKLSIKNIDPAAEGFDEIQKALEEGTQESVENVAKAVSEHYGVPYVEALEGVNGGKAICMKQTWNKDCQKKYHSIDRLSDIMSLV